MMTPNEATKRKARKKNVKKRKQSKSKSFCEVTKLPNKTTRKINQQKKRETFGFFLFISASVI